MKKLSIVIGILIVVVGAIGFNVWSAYHFPLTSAPTQVQIGRTKLHAQLEQSEQLEAGVEKQDWNSIALLNEVIKAHEDRIDKLNGNNEAGEIVAHDHDAIARLQKRITDLDAQAAAQAAKAAAEQEREQEQDDDQQP